jgi:hypothetical protein
MVVSMDEMTVFYRSILRAGFVLAQIETHNSLLRQHGGQPTSMATETKVEPKVQVKPKLGGGIFRLVPDLVEAVPV